MRILYVDHAGDFGGSLIVADTLVGEIAPQEITAVVAVAFKNAFSDRLFESADKVVRCWIPLSYTAAWRVKAAIARVPIPRLRRLLYLGLSIVDLVSSGIYCAQLIGVILLFRVRLVHTNNSIEAVIAAKLARRRVVFHLHGPVLRRIRLLNTCNAVVAISDYVKSRMLEVGLSEDVLTVIPNGIRIEPVALTARDSVYAQLGLQPDVPLISLPGRIVAWKGQEQFLYAAQLVLQKVPKAHFAIVGSTSDGDRGFQLKLFELARQLQIEDRVHWTGYVHNVRDYMSASAVVVHASIEPEPFGLVIVEGMATGRPVVASSLGAGQEIITHEVDGLLVDPRSAKALAEAITRLLVDRDLAEAMGAAGQSTVEKRYSATAMSDAFLALYRRLLI